VTDVRTLTHLRGHRERAGLSQTALAERVGVSRQALVAIEAGRQVPSTGLALRLARALGRSVEDLFELSDGGGLAVALAPPPAWSAAVSSARRATRVAVGQVGDRFVAHRLADEAPAAADGLLSDAAPGERARVELLTDVREIERNVLVAGCAPLLGVLAQRVGRRHRDARATFLRANSERALDLLADGFVHVAGLHLGAEDGPDVHAALVRERFPGRDMLLVHLARWRVGAAIARGNPRGVRRPTDLLRPDVRFVAREEGAGVTRLLGRLLAGDGAADRVPRRGPLATDHAAVAEVVRCGGADAGVTIESAALAAGLDFLPWVEERFDLVVAREQAALPHVATLLESLDDPAFRAETARLPGYDGALMGRVSAVAS